MTTIADRIYMGKVAELGCAICRMLGYGQTPAEVHHQRTGTGAGKRASDRNTVPLCPTHHRGNVGLHGMGRKAFERHYGVTELELVEQTRRAINVRCSQYVEKKHGQ